MNTPIVTPLPPTDFRRKPWKNGGGVTVDIADAYRDGAVPGSWEGTVWRLGRTAIVEPGPFSDLTGYERLQVVIAGSGLVLESADGEIDLRQPFKPMRYDGGTPITSRLENGPVEVVNLIADRALVAIEMIVPEPNAAITLSAGIHVIYAPVNSVSGTCDSAPFEIEPGHALRIDLTQSCRLVTASGQALMATIRPR